MKLSKKSLIEMAERSRRRDELYLQIRGEVDEQLDSSDPHRVSSLHLSNAKRPTRRADDRSYLKPITGEIPLMEFARAQAKRLGCNVDSVRQRVRAGDYDAMISKRHVNNRIIFVTIINPNAKPPEIKRRNCKKWRATTVKPK
jgi:hypothetical protein